MPKKRNVISRRGELTQLSGLMLTSMVDVMAMLVVFLLMNYNDLQVQIKESDDLRLPESTAQANPETAVNIVVTTQAIYAEEKKVAELTDFAVPAALRESAGSYLIVPLANELKGMAEKAKAIINQSKKEEDIALRGQPFEGTAIIQADRNIPFSLLRDVMYSAGQAEFSNFRFLVLRKL